jgi:hypothetical protein
LKLAALVQALSLPSEADEVVFELIGKVSYAVQAHRATHICICNAFVCAMAYHTEIFRGSQPLAGACAEQPSLKMNHIHLQKYLFPFNTVMASSIEALGKSSERF